MPKKPSYQLPEYCDQCHSEHKNPCPSPAEIMSRCVAERAEWTETEAERREPGKPQPVELAEYQRPRRAVKVELGRR